MTQSAGYQHSLPPGTRVENYEILAELGHGGFGITYKARDNHLQCIVAIKEYLPADVAARAMDGLTVLARSEACRADYEQGRTWFLEEAQRLARFKNPNVVRVSRFLEANGTAYIVMDYEEGETLAQYVDRKGPLAEQQLIAVFVPVLDGLQVVHDADLLHRDIKPANIYLRQDGRPMLIDFGAARQALGGHSRSLTAMLSEGYGPFEQYSSRAAQGPFTDLYAVGAAMYRCIGMRRPPPAPDRVQAVNAGEPDPLVPATEIGRGRYSEPLLAIIDWLLQIQPTDRPQRVEAVLARLAAANPLAHQATVKAAPLDALAAAPDRRKPKPKPKPKPGPVRTGISVSAGVIALVALVVGTTWLAGFDPFAFVGSQGVREPRMVALEGGCFAMGSPMTESGREDNERAHQVCVRPFELAAHEVTVGEFRAFVQATGYRTDAERDRGCWIREAGDWREDPAHTWRNPGFSQDDDHPVVCVSWNDAVAYVDWLSAVTENEFRLPTEAEWEFAARGDTRTPHFWGADPSRVCEYANIADPARAPDRSRPTAQRPVPCADGYRYTAPVGTYKANPFRLYDMLGNALEWTCSAYSAAYDGAEKRCAGHGRDLSRVMRGGSWTVPPAGARSAARSRSSPDISLNALGFRVARD